MIRVVVLCILLLMGGVLTSPITSDILSSQTGSHLTQTEAPNFQDFKSETGKQNAGESPDIGYKFIHEGNAWLRLNTAPASWADADRQCRLEGGVLAAPTTRALTQAMLAMMATEQLTSNDSVFTAASTNISTESNPLISEQDSAERTVEYCVVLTGEGKVDYEPCTSKKPFFCIKIQSHAGYEWSPRSKSCYKFHRVAKTWHNAAKTCRDEGAHLAIINSDVEHQVLKDIFERNPQNTIVEANNAVVAIIGFWKWDNGDGEWMTIHGETLAEAGFDKWSRDPPQPDNAGGSEYCGSILRTGLLNDVPCNDKPFAFICEINP